jgi:hypothetical protein
LKAAAHAPGRGGEKREEKRSWGGRRVEEREKLRGGVRN